MIARNTVRRVPFALAVCAAAVLAAAIMASPAHAQTLVTTTGTFTMRNGDSVTLVQTYLDGVLTTTSYTEVSPTGLVVVDRDIAYYPNGQMSALTEVRTSMGGAYQTTTNNQYDENGVLRQQYVKIVSDSQVIAEQFSAYDASGYLATQETRTLTTLADGTQVWDATDEVWSSGVLVSSTTTEYPLGYDFNATPVVDPSPVVDPTPIVDSPPVVNAPPVVDSPPVVDTPPVLDNPPAVEEPPVVDNPPPVVETPPTQPGNGNGDENHQHTGAPGQTGDNERPGNGNGDSHHEHSGHDGKGKAE